MPITICSLQKQQSLEAVYAALVNDAHSAVWAEIGYTMLAFLEMINTTFPETQLWGLTSHDRLVLLNNDDAYSNWWVIISCMGQKEIYFEYLVPAEKAPWPGATVRGTAGSLAEAKKYLLIAMKESGGWPNNRELEQQLKGIN
jgi:hypothetical protein